MKMRSVLQTLMVAAAVLLPATVGQSKESIQRAAADSDQATESDSQVIPTSALSHDLPEPCANRYDAGECEECQPCACSPRWLAFGEYLYLRPRNAGLEYAVPINGPITSGQVPIQDGRTAAVNPQFSSGFRVGIGTQFSECSFITGSYTRYENRVRDSIGTDAPMVLRSMVMHPSSADAAADWLSASAQQDIAYDMADLDYRRTFLGDECGSLNYLIGVRYASLKQRFRSDFAAAITESVDSDVNFDGAGLRFGLEGERHSTCNNLFVYGKGYASFLGGEFRGNYLQGSINDPVVAATDWKEARLVSILECELGIGWQSTNGHVRASAGYMVSGWLNVVKTSEFISSVQANQYHGPDKIDGNGLEFDGLVTRLEFLW